MKFCPNCGQSVAVNNKYCANCGYNLESSSFSTPVNQTSNNVTHKKNNTLETFSLIFGIMSLLGSLILLLLSGEHDLDLILDFLEVFTEVFAITGTGVRIVYIIFNAGFILFLGILSLSFGINNRKSGLGKIGIIFSSIAIVITIITSIKILFI